MLNNIIKFSLNNKYFILLSSVLLVVFGMRTATNMDVDVFPDLTAPTVVVMTDAHGMASEEVERLVTFPIETAVNGATDVRRVSLLCGSNLTGELMFSKPDKLLAKNLFVFPRRCLWGLGNLS